MATRFQWKAQDGKEQTFLLSSSEIVIGRRDAQLVIANQFVSRQHAKVNASAEGHLLVDLTSTFGTYVNGRKIETHILRHGDKVTFGKDETEFHFHSGEAEPLERGDTTTAGIVQRSLDDLNRVLPSAASDLERILCMLEFQQHWSEVFTPENSLEQILESALKISGAERAFIMVRKAGAFGYASGRDGRGQKLSETN